MIHRIIYLIAYMVVFPMGLGCLVQSMLWRVAPKSREFRVKALDCYVSGVLGTFFLFEFLSKWILADTSEYIAFLSYTSKSFMVMLGLVVVGVLFLFIIRWKSMVHTILQNLKIQSHKSNNTGAQNSVLWRTLIPVAAVLIYIAVAVLFVAPNPLDDTIVDIISMFKWNGIAVFEPYKWTPLSGMEGHTKLIEMLYASYADMIGMGFTPFIEYIVSAFYLVFFFAVYKRIEEMIFHYIPSLRENRIWMERIFFVFCIALFFIDGSLEMSIPQNIWNGTTLLASTVMPLGFTYGFCALMEWEHERKLNSVLWILRMVLLLPAAALLHDRGYQLMTILILITLLIMGYKVLRERFILNRHLGREV